MLIENIKLALNSLKANKMRALLTMLGIIIGIGSVITIVIIGDSIAGSVNSEMQGFGASNITVMVQDKNSFNYDPYNPDSEYEYVQMKDSDYLTIDMIKDYQRTFKDNVKAVSISDSIAQYKTINKRRKATVDIYGVNEGYQTLERIQMLQGEFINESDIDKVANSTVVSDKFILEYFGPNMTYEEALGKGFEIEMNNQLVNVYIKGVYKYVAPPYDFNETSTKILIPYSLGFKVKHSLNLFQSITVLPKEGMDILKFQTDTNTFFQSYYTQNKNYTAHASSMTQYVNSTNAMMNKIKLGISAVAAISLLVGGIGIMNIMMVSVTERTREIGIRMALGAKGRIIRGQFIIEAMIVSLIGGIIGITLGIIVGSIGASMLHYAAKPSLIAIISAVSFSMAIGIFFGYYPANKASKLDPIEALRYE